MDITDKDAQLKRKVVLDKFIFQFTFPRDGFSPIKPWTDGFGFSRVKKFPNKYVSIYQFSINDSELQNSSPKKSLWINVSYGKEVSEDTISLGLKKLSLSDPIGLDSKNEFFYDINENKFYFHKLESSPEKVFLMIDNLHMKPTKKFGGLILRCRLWFWRKLLPYLVKFFDIFIIGVLWVVSGEKIKKDIFHRLLNFKDDTPLKELEFEQSSTMDFFGYKAKRHSVVFYCGLHLFIFLVTFWLGVQYPLWLVKIFKNEFIVLCYTVCSFAFTEAFIPNILRWTILKVTPKAFENISFKKLEV